MSESPRLETALRAAIDHARAGAPPGLGAALEDAVFPGGARVRPRLCLAVAAAFGDPRPAVADAAAVAVELLHCASLVHDDLPCFDDAAVRRGRPSVHAAHGQALAVLAGDALLVLAFETLALGASGASRDAAQLVQTVARGVASPHGIIAGQAWESEACVPASMYRRAKTAALFVAAASGGAIAAGSAPEPWRDFAERLGEAYQVADDLDDLVGDAAVVGKPVGRDLCLGRPNAADELGIPEARRALGRLLGEAAESVPPCAHPERIQAWIREIAAGVARRDRARTRAA